MLPWLSSSLFPPASTPLILRSQGQRTAAAQQARRPVRHQLGLVRPAHGGTRVQNGGTSLPRSAPPASSVATEGQSSPPRSSSFLFVVDLYAGCSEDVDPCAGAGLVGNYRPWAGTGRGWRGFHPNREWGRAFLNLHVHPN
jgi:hypothetical protein